MNKLQRVNAANVKIGLRVKLVPESPYRHQTLKDEWGTIVNIKDRTEKGWVSVEWDKSSSNSYQIQDENSSGDLLYNMPIVDLKFKLPKTCIV